MKPSSMPKASSRTLASTARQFVVQDALEIDEVVLRVELLLVHADHEGRVRICGRGGDHDTGRARFEVRASPSPGWCSFRSTR